jgi:hypothetical protein
VHQKIVALRIREVAKVARLGSKILDAVRRGIAAAARTEKIEQRGEFLWRVGHTRPEARDRSDLPSTERGIEYVAPEEIRVAIKEVVNDAFGVNRSEAATAAARILGYQRVPRTMMETLSRQVEVLIQSGELDESNDEVRLKTPDSHREP